MCDWGGGDRYSQYLLILRWKTNRWYSFFCSTRKSHSVNASTAGFKWEGGGTTNLTKHLGDRHPDLFKDSFKTSVLVFLFFFMWDRLWYGASCTCSGISVAYWTSGTVTSLAQTNVSTISVINMHNKSTWKYFQQHLFKHSIVTRAPLLGIASSSTTHLVCVWNRPQCGA